MTESKAIELLEYIRETGNGEAPYVGCAQNIAIEMAINALGNQIPKKPTKDKYVPELDFCPECGTEVTNCNYCPHCGQNIDWSEQVQRKEN